MNGKIVKEKNSDFENKIQKYDLSYKSLISNPPKITNKYGVIQFIKKLNNLRQKLEDKF